MRYLSGAEKMMAELYCGIASKVALHSKCRKSKHGVAIVQDKRMIASGYNTPVGKIECSPCLRDDIHDNGRIELCNSLHAEHVAVINGLESGYDLRGSTMYHARLKQGQLVRSNIPSCTSCSRLVVYTGIKDFVLVQEEGFACYDAEEFNRLSFEYFMGKR